MDRSLQSKLSMFGDVKYQHHLRAIQRGVERETLRVGLDGRPSKLPHPSTLGAALTHTTVTTDFSEALLELITKPSTSVAMLVQTLDEIHACVAQSLSEEEYLWAASMPCALDCEESVPIADYGRSNTGLIKTVYRRGLAERYGRYMQSIAGIHYNFSMPIAFWPDYARVKGVSADNLLATNSYLDLIRNCRMDAWLLVYLFGSSPVAPKHYIRAGQEHYSFERTAGGDYGLPYATAMRLSKIGYQSTVQNNIRVCTNSLAEYMADLCHAVLNDHSEYAAIGLERDGEYIQLGTGLLQVENEYYGVIRPKQETPKGMPTLKALQQQGVAYVELRCLDLDPMYKLGMDSTTAYFLDAFLLRCLLRDSPFLSAEDERRALDRFTMAVEEGRNPDLLLSDGDKQKSVSEWGAEVMKECHAVAEALDETHEGTPHADACRAQDIKLQDSKQTPSGRMLTDMAKNGRSHFDFVSEKSLKHTEDFRATQLAPKRLKEFAAECASSVERRRQLEDKQHTQNFSDYRDAYYRDYRSVCAKSQQ